MDRKQGEIFRFYLFLFSRKPWAFSRERSFYCAGDNIFRKNVTHFLFLDETPKKISKELPAKFGQVKTDTTILTRKRISPSRLLFELKGQKIQQRDKWMESRGAEREII